MTQRRLEITADLLAEGYEPDEIGVRELVERTVRELVNFEVSFYMAGQNVDRGDPRWGAVESVKTGIHEGLYGVLCEVLNCGSEYDGSVCYLGMGHEGLCADGNGNSWVRDGEGGR